VGVSINGVNAIQSGSAQASSERNGIAVAIGSNSTATARGGDNNLALAFATYALTASHSSWTAMTVSCD
jgi:hypothetical protein